MPPTDRPELEAALSLIAAEWSCSPRALRTFLDGRQQAASAATLPPPGSETVAFDGLPERASGPPAPGPGMPDRYEDLGLIGQGAMGEVRRVRDRHLQRTLAMKIIHAGIKTRPTLAARFESEARATARLQHPGVVPVHDMGRLADGRVWFTMKEVKGKELEEVIRDLHAVSRSQWQAPPSGWTLRRLVEAFRRICETMAYAHSRGVLHRDLKPSNLMVGEHGEVMVLDWGIAKLLSQPPSPGAAAPLSPGESPPDQTRYPPTQMGAVAGTPAYMAPEQARGEIDQLDARTDVYALGAVLYHVLSGRPPYLPHPTESVLGQVLAGPPPPLTSSDPGLRSDRPGPPLPAALVEICARAMARDPAHRTRSAAELAQSLNAWLDGLQRRVRAHEVIALARERRAEARRLDAEALEQRTKAEAALRDVESWQPEEDRHAGWAHQEAAAALEREATLLKTESERLLQASLTHAPDLPEAHAALADTYRAQHEEAEARGRDVHRAAAFLEQHLSALPPADARRLAHRSYLTGDGALTLLTDPPGAQVTLHRHERIHKRLRLGPGTSLGTTPLRAVSLPMGSYTCVVQHPDRDPVRYPILIERGQHWTGIAPDEVDPTPVHLPAQGVPGAAYIPAGWFRAGASDGFASRFPSQWIWCDGMVMMRDPVTHADYCAYLNHLLEAGESEAAEQAIPEVSPATDSPWTRRSRRVELRAPPGDPAWTPDHPVRFISWHQAAAYAGWYAAHTGLPWRLPHELEWEKAARGVDGRQYPWGDEFCPAWCHVAGSRQHATGPSAMGAFPADQSPYGVRGMAGNLMDWCADVFQADHIAEPLRRIPDPGPADSPVDRDAHRVLRGGAWCYNAEYAKLTARGRGRPDFKSTFTGLRLVHGLEPGSRCR